MAEVQKFCFGLNIIQVSSVKADSSENRRNGSQKEEADEALVLVLQP